MNHGMVKEKLKKAVLLFGIAILLIGGLPNTIARPNNPMETRLTQVYAPSDELRSCSFSDFLQEKSIQGPKLHSSQGASWFDANWQFRKRHSISADTDFSNYPVSIEVNSGFGTDSDNRVFCEGQCKADFGDIRFTQEEQVTPLPFWIEETGTGLYGPYALFWVKIPLIPEIGGTDIYMYFGNPSSSTTSNISETMIFGDDFSGTTLDTGKWSVKEYPYGAHNYDLSDGELHIHAYNDNSLVGAGENSGYRFITQQSFTETDFAVRVRARWENFDYFKGIGAWDDGVVVGWVQALLTDDEGDLTGEVGLLSGDDEILFQRYQDTQSYSSQVYPLDLPYGAGTFDFTCSNDEWSIDLSEYAHSWTGSLPDFQPPFNLSISTVLDYWTDKVEIDTYYDFVFIRPFVPNEPTHGNWGVLEQRIGFDIRPLLLFILIFAIVLLLFVFIFFRRRRTAQSSDEELDLSVEKPSGVSSAETPLTPGRFSCWECGAVIGPDQAVCPRCETRRSRCMICKQFLTLDDEYTKCPYCGQLAHRDHLVEWLKIKEFCPYCKQKLREVEVA